MPPPRTKIKITVARCGTWILGFVLLLVSLQSDAQETRQRVDPLDLYAAFITKFPYFVEWPTRQDSNDGKPIRIGILGKDVFTDTTKRSMARQKYNGETLQLEEFQELESIRPVDILFVSDQFASQLEKVIAATKGKRILTVAAIPRFAEKGGMIHFTTENNRVRFIINLRQARQENIRISAHLLRTAKVLR